MYDPAHARSRTVQPMGGNLKPDLTLKTCLVYQLRFNELDIHVRTVKLPLRERDTGETSARACHAVTSPGSRPCCISV